MKKPLPVPPVRKKGKTNNKPKTKKTASGTAPKSEFKENEIKTLINQARSELIELLDGKFNTLNHRFDRLEDGISEILDELRETEALLESGTEPYEGQA